MLAQTNKEKKYETNQFPGRIFKNNLYIRKK